MTTLTTNTGRTIKISSNKSERTFTIRVEGAKYRTCKMSKIEYNSCLNNTGNDWQHYLNDGDYYLVK